MYCLQILLVRRKKNLHAIPPALAYLEGDPRRNDIDMMVRPASVLQLHKHIFVPHAVSLGTTHAHVGLF